MMGADTESRSVLVREMRWEARGVVSLTLEDFTGQPLPTWSAGAHIDLHIKDVACAQYSLCGRPDDRSWKIAVLHQPVGKGVSSFVHQRLRPGDVVNVSAPRNHFSLQRAQEYLFIAGGIGITPILAMTREAAARDVPWRLLYGGRTRDAMAFYNELQSQPNVQLFPQDRTGLLPVRKLLESAGANTSVYCCGPEGLLQVVRAECARTGLADPHFERFSPIETNSSKPANTFFVELARSGMTLSVSPSESIADVLDAHGIFVPTSCREGICGSCETRVVAGEIDHRDSILSETERQCGGTMMVCVSRARGGTITLDI
jgi:tetrachlorobenzoquinone reductase